jgi:hypothetical protein
VELVLALILAYVLQALLVLYVILFLLVIQPVKMVEHVSELISATNVLLVLLIAYVVQNILVLLFAKTEEHVLGQIFVLVELDFMVLRVVHPFLVFPIV